MKVLQALEAFLSSCRILVCFRLRLFALFSAAQACINRSCSPDTFPASCPWF